MASTSFCNWKKKHQENSHPIIMSYYVLFFEHIGNLQYAQAKNENSHFHNIICTLDSHLLHLCTICNSFEFYLNGRSGHLTNLLNELNVIQTGGSQ